MGKVGTAAPLPRSYWVDDHVIAGVYPGAPTQAEAEEKVRLLVAAGVTLFLDLTTPDDHLRPYEPLLASIDETARVRRVSLPVPDLSVASEATVEEALRLLDAEAEAGGLSYVHCWGGIGRTGTIIGCYLARHLGGEAALTALTKLRAGYPDGPRSSPETAGQVDLVRRWPRSTRWGTSPAECEQLVPAGGHEVPLPVERMTALLEAWAIGFAARRPDVAGHDLTSGSRGLHPDECASFLRALDAGQLHVDSAGYVTPLAARTKAVGGRYAVCCKSGEGVTVNTEYIVQLGAVGELVSSWGWDAQDLQVEMTEFDIAGFGPDGRVVLAVEAKAWVTGPDSLEKLLRSLQALSAAGPPKPRGNAERKYLQLLRFCETGPVALWLIAAGARWLFLVTPRGDRLAMTPIVDVRRNEVLAMTELA